MNKLLTDEQRELQSMAREFARKELIPISAECDLKGEFPRHLYKKACEMGFTSITTPLKYGGAGLGVLEQVIVEEELAYGDAGFAVSFGASNSLGTIPVELAGTEKQKQRRYDFMQNGGIAAFCLTESEAGSDAANVRTTAVKDGNDYIINGSKCFITNGGIADIYTVFATIDRGLGAKGITAFEIEAGTAGLSVGREENKMGIRSSNTADVIFEDVRIPAANMLGDIGQGYKLALSTLDRTRSSGACATAGICHRAIDLCIKYAKERITFGKPIISNQAIQFMLADMEIKTEAARSMIWLGAQMQDKGIVDSVFGAATKTFCGDAVMAVTTDAVQIFGGYGYSRDYPVEKLMRDAKIFQIFEGTNQIQRMVIGRNLARR